MNRCILVPGIARPGASWIGELSIESVSLDWQSQTDAFVCTTTYAISTDGCGACKHLQRSVTLADVAV